MSDKAKTAKETVYDRLDKEEKAVQIPYYVHEMEMTRLDRINKRLWIILIVIFLAFVGTNAGWIVYENQFEDISISQEGQTEGGGSNYFNGNIHGSGEVNYYGESEADNQNTSPEDGR